MTIKELKPTSVWNNFYSLTRCPRPSKHEEKVREFLLKWASDRKIEAFADETGNIIMRVPATPGCENFKGVILQGHMDMVPQKNADKVHDFLKDPIETVVDGDWLRADGTTLGADDGLGVALGMSVLEDRSLKHGPLELLVTYDEETGMTGAKNLKPGVLKGEILINLDSEDEGELCVGCAGGLDANVSGTYKRKAEPRAHQCWTLAVKACRGGHSGLEINEGRANANKVAARILYALMTKAGVKLLDMEGGNMRNAIPRDCVSTVYVPDAKLASAKRLVKKLSAEIKSEFALTDPDMNFIFEPYVCAPGEVCDPGDCKYVEEDAALRFVRAILACPSGVERMSPAIPGLVETSNNLAIVKAYRGKFEIKNLMRSSVDTAKFALAAKIESVFTLAGMKTVFSGAYSGWAPNPKSEIRTLMESKYKKLFGKDAKVMAVHAGLECGIMAGAYPGWDMVSTGPTLRSPHSPAERAYIPSVQKVWDFLVAVLSDIPCK